MSNKGKGDLENESAAEISSRHFGNKRLGFEEFGASQVPRSLLKVTETQDHHLSCRTVIVPRIMAPQAPCAVRPKSLAPNQSRDCCEMKEKKKLGNTKVFVSTAFSWPQFHLLLLRYSITKSCPTLCDPMDCSMPGFPVLHHLPELAQTHVH